MKLRVIIIVLLFASPGIGQSARQDGVPEYPGGPIVRIAPTREQMKRLAEEEEQKRKEEAHQARIERAQAKESERLQKLYAHRAYIARRNFIKKKLEAFYTYAPLVLEDIRSYEFSFNLFRSEQDAR